MHLIVGVDPGKTVGIACVSLDGSLVMSAHMEFAGFEWMIRRISEVGEPSIVASDRKEASTAVRRVCAAFNATLYQPKSDISASEKRRVARDNGISDPHERDACAAAVDAYNAYANKLKQAERLARQSGIGDVDTIKAMVVERYSIDEALHGRRSGRRRGSPRQL